MYRQIPPKFTVSVKSNTAEIGSTHLSYLLAKFLAEHGFSDVVVDSPMPPEYIDHERRFDEFPRTAASVVVQDFGSRASHLPSRQHPVTSRTFRPDPQPGNPNYAWTSAPGQGQVVPLKR